MVRCWKRIAGTSRHAHTESLWGPWRDGSLGLRRSEHLWQVVVAREWVRQGAWAEDHFKQTKKTYLAECHAHKSRCPAVLTLRQCNSSPALTPFAAQPAVGSGPSGLVNVAPGPLCRHKPRPRAPPNEGRHPRPDIPPVVTTHQTTYGDVTHVQLPLAVYSVALTLWYRYGDPCAPGGVLRSEHDLRT